MKSIYFRILKEDIKKIQNIEHLDHMIDLIFTDLKSYLYNEESEGVTAQWFIGMHQVFRGWVVRNWQNPQEIQPKKLHEINKIIIRNSVWFYSAVWKQRNDTLHSPEKYKTFVIK